MEVPTTPNAAKDPLLEQTKRAPPERAGHQPTYNASSRATLTTPVERLRRCPACQTPLRDLSHVPANLQFDRCSIQTIGTAEYTEVPNHAEINAVVSELRHFANFAQIHVSGASRWL
jgi:hypothetical protein